MDVVIKVFLYIWQLPQNIFGLLTLLFFKRKLKEVQAYKTSKVYWINSRAGWGVSLGSYIFLTEVYGQNTVKHEYGHSIQSMILGPLYLLLVGLPSIVQNILSRIIGGSYSKNYYNRYPENWADKLGGVIR